MALIDIDELVAPLSDESPAGEDMDGTTERYAIEEPFQVETGEDDGAEADLDWRGTVRRILDQAAQTRDLWLATYLMRAGTKLGDLDTVTSGAQLLAGLLERQWEHVHPQLEMVDFIGRKAPCEALTKYRDFLAPLRKVILIEHPRLGRYSGEDLERFATEGEGADGYGMFRAALESMAAEDIRVTVDRLDAIRDALRRSDTVLTAHAGDDTSTNFQPTYEAIEAIRRSVAPYAGLGGEADAAAATPSDAESSSAGAAGIGADDGGAFRVAGRIDSRDDVVKALDAIGDYYRLREPSSPVPALLRRARAWVGMDFLAVLEDLTPDSMADARKVLGVKPEEENIGW